MISVRLLAGSLRGAVAPRSANGSARRVFVFLGCFALLSGAVRASDYSITIPFPVRIADWEETEMLFSAPPQQSITPNGPGRTDFSLAPVASPATVFVTVIFKESLVTPVTLSWQSSVSSLRVPLSEDLSEGAAGWSQRTLRLPAGFSAQGGTFILGGDQRAIARVRFDWLKPMETFVAVDQPQPGLLLGGRLVENDMLSGNPELSPPDAWFGDILEASLQDAVESLDGGLLFEVPLDQTRGTVILKAKLQGVGLEDPVEIWVNESYAGALHPAVPPLTDPGYVRLPDGTVIYAGWRDAALFVPEGLLMDGENTIELRPFTPGCSVRDAALQILVPMDDVSADPIDLGWPEL